MEPAKNPLLGINYIYEHICSKSRNGVYTMWFTAGAHNDGWNKARENKELQSYADLIPLKTPLPKPSHLFICRCSQRGLYCSKKSAINLTSKIPFCFVFRSKAAVWFLRLPSFLCVGWDQKESSAKEGRLCSGGEGSLQIRTKRMEWSEESPPQRGNMETASLTDGAGDLDATA